MIGKYINYGDRITFFEIAAGGRRTRRVRRVLDFS